MREHSLVSDVIKIPSGHVIRLDAFHEDTSVLQVEGGLGGCVVDDHSLDLAF